MELSCNDLFLYLGRCAPEHPMPEETKGEQLDWEMYMESVIVVCGASPSIVHLCAACARVCFGMGD